MKPTEKIKKDQQRQVQAVDAALASIERSDGSSSSLFPTLDSKVAYVQALYAHKPRDDETMLPPTRTLTERVKLKKDEQYQKKLGELQVQRQMLQASKAQIEKEAESIHAPPAKKGASKPMTMREALDHDTRLGAMSANEVLKEFVGKEERAVRKMASMSKRAVASPREERKEEEDEDEDEDEEEDEEEEDESEEEDDEEEDESEEESSEEDDESEVISPGKKSTAAPSVKSSRSNQSHASNAVEKKSRKDEEFMRALEQETGIGMKKALAPPPPPLPSGDFKSIVKSIAGSISGQEHSLKELKMKQALTLKKIQWMNKRPATYERGSFFPSTAKGRVMKDLCAQMVEELVDKAWHKISMRPNPKDVAREVQEFKAKHLTVLLGIGRHLVDAIVKDVVDELIIEVASESNGLQKAADLFAFDLLVEAVAASQPDQKHGFRFKGEDVHARMKEVSKAQEMVLRQKVEEKKAIVDANNRAALSRGMESRAVRFASGQKADPEGGAGGGDGGGVNVSDSFKRLDAKSWDRLMPDRPKVKTDGSRAAGDKLSDQSDIYAMQRSLDEGISLSDKAIYIMGLKGMLEEMKRRRGDAPYGHTQQLAIAWPRGIHLSRARVLAAQRMKPSLTAGAAVWKIREEHKLNVKLGHSAHKRHLRAAGIESSFWAKVVFQVSQTVSHQSICAIKTIPIN